MNSDFTDGYATGLREALRLMDLNESLDFAPGMIMNRLKQLESETDPYTTLNNEQLRSAIIQRDDQLRRALARIKQLECELESRSL